MGGEYGDGCEDEIGRRRDLDIRGELNDKGEASRFRQVLHARVRKSENFLDKTRKSHQFLNSRQIRIKSVFARFKHKHSPNMFHGIHL